MMFPFRGTHVSVDFFHIDQPVNRVVLGRMLEKLAIYTKRKKGILPNQKERYNPGGKNICQKIPKKLATVALPRVGVGATQHTAPRGTSPAANEKTDYLLHLLHLYLLITTAKFT